ncbi:MAG: hypothetical protein ABSH10_04275 [Phycisphaerae bacterium]|jgi:hypothetical protein
MKASAAGLLAAAVLIALAAQGWTAPKPAEIPRYWQIDITFGDILPIQVKLPTEAAPRTFWYLRYKVTNNTGQDRIFVPEFLLYTDSGQVLRAWHQVPSSVFEEIKKTYNDPLLEDLSGTTGSLLQGAENAKEGVAIWTDFDPNASAFDVFVSGLSGETEEFQLPKPIHVTETDAAGKKVEVVKTTILLAKTLERHYAVAGEPAARSAATVHFLDEEWVMR